MEREKKYIIDNMTLKDCVSVARIDKISIANPWSYKDYCDAVEKQEYVYLVARQNDEVIGFAGFIQALDEADITHIAVEPSCRGCHIGEALLEELLKTAYERGIHVVFLEVRFNNEAAKSLYDKMGFENLGMRKKYYKNPVEDAIIMKKTL